MLRSMGVLSGIDRNAIIRYCIFWSQWHLAQQFVAKNGLVYPIKDGNGKVKCLAAFPHVAIVTRLGLLLTKFEQEFGMTPSARTRIECTAETQEDETIEQYLKGRQKEEKFFGKPVNGRSAEEVLKMIWDSEPHELRIAP